MLPLTISRAETGRFEFRATSDSPVSAWRPPDSPVSAWRGADGTVAAYCYRRYGTAHVDLPSVGSFCFEEPAQRIHAFPARAVTDEHVVSAHRRTVVPLALQTLGYEVLHASAASMPIGVVAFCGPSGVGKSTLANALGLRGHPVRADDVVALRFLGDNPTIVQNATVIQLPFTLRLSADARAALGDEAELRPIEEIAGQPLAAVVALERVGAGEGFTELERVPQMAAFKKLFSHGLCFSRHQRERMALMIDHYLALAATVPVYRAGLPSDLRRLADAVDKIEAGLA